MPRPHPCRNEFCCFSDVGGRVQCRTELCVFCADELRAEWCRNLAKRRNLIGKLHAMPETGMKEIALLNAPEEYVDSLQAASPLGPCGNEHCCFSESAGRVTCRSELCVFCDPDLFKEWCQNPRKRSHLIAKLRTIPEDWMREAALFNTPAEWTRSLAKASEESVSLCLGQTSSRESAATAAESTEPAELGAASSRESALRQQSCPAHEASNPKSPSGSKEAPSGSRRKNATKKRKRMLSSSSCSSSPSTFDDTWQSSSTSD